MTKGLVALVIPFAHARHPYAGHARSRAVDASVSLTRGLAAVPAARRAVVRARIVAQPGVRAILLHSRAFRALPDDGASARRAPGGISCRCSPPACCRGPACSCGDCVAAGTSRSRPGAFAWTRFCLIWCAFVLVFFSISGSKLPSYILPIFPAAALVLGGQLERMAPRTLALLAAVIASHHLPAVARQCARLDADHRRIRRRTHAARDVLHARPLGQARVRRRRGRLRCWLGRRSAAHPSAGRQPALRRCRWPRS